MQDNTEDKSGIRIFTVLMDKNKDTQWLVLMGKNKDTQWLEDGVFVENPLPKPCVRATSSPFQDALGTLCGMHCVKEVSVAPYSSYAVYTVEGTSYSNPSLLLQRKVTVHY
jgi:hypothetical protein